MLESVIIRTIIWQYLLFNNGQYCFQKLNGNICIILYIKCK